MAEKVEQRELLSFASQLNAEVRDRAEGASSLGTHDFRVNVFTEIVCENLAAIGALEDFNVAFYEGRVGRTSLRINGYGISDMEDALDLLTVVFLDSSTASAVGKEEITGAVSKAECFVVAALTGKLSDVERSSDAWSMISRIAACSKTIRRCRIFVLTDGLAPLRSLEPTEVEAVPTSCEIWDIERLYRAVPAGLRRDEIAIDFERDFGGAIPCLPITSGTDEYMAYSAAIPGEIVCRLYESYGARLLELNVRSFLSARGKVNSGIRKTLREEPHRFLAYNNGIVVTVDHIEVGQRSDGQTVIKAVRGLQIVNGGQTTASIHRARMVDHVDISRVLVPAKITLIDPAREEEIVRQVSRCANTQNVIQIADFSSNDPFHIEIERMSERIWNPGQAGRWFYDRARGQYQVAKSRRGTTAGLLRRFNAEIPPNRKFTKTDLAKFMHAWAQLPHVVSMGSQKNFDRFMQDIRTQQGKDWIPDERFYRELIAKAIIFRAMERIVREELFPAYRANIVAFVVAYLASMSGGRLDLESVWLRQDISEQLRNALRRWAHVIAAALTTSAQGKNITEWCKKEACWQHVRMLGLGIDGELPPEFSGVSAGKGAPRGSVTEVSNAAYLSSMDRCKRIDGETWLKIAAWGAKSGQLQKWQSGIAHTLAGYAATGWSRSPSPKQAKHAIRILEIAAEHEVVLTNAPRPMSPE